MWRYLHHSASLKAGGVTLASLSSHSRQRALVDSVRVEIQAGNGGDGAVSYLPRSPGRRSPDGGHGGRGGDVVIKAESEVRDLSLPSFHIKGFHGGRGAGKGMTGRAGADKIIRVPVGTCVYKAPPSRKERADFIRENDEPPKAELALVADLSTPGAMFVAAKGGHPGRGNIVQMSESYQFYKPLDSRVIQGKAGEVTTVLLKLKSIADVGLVGFPNAGKSSLLTAISLAQPKVAPYPFTTLHPQLGYVHYNDGLRISVADLPGLVDGAHENRGLGHRFLQHVERTKVLVFVVDVCPSFEGRGRTAGEDLLTLIDELDRYQPGLSTRPSIVVANKMDSAHAARGLQTLEKAVQGTRLIVPLSARSGAGVAEFARQLRALVTALGPPTEVAPASGNPFPVQL